MARRNNRKVVAGLAYRILSPQRYECCRCRQVVVPGWHRGFEHVCIPSRMLHDYGHLGGYDPSASLHEQLEALSLLFANLAAKGYDPSQDMPF